MYIVTKRGQKKLRKTTCGWKLLVKWKDKTESWIPLCHMKESHPVEVAEFAKLILLMINQLLLGGFLIRLGNVK